MTLDHNNRPVAVTSGDTFVNIHARSVGAVGGLSMVLDLGNAEELHRDLGKQIEELREAQKPKVPRVRGTVIETTVGPYVWLRTAGGWRADADRDSVYNDVEFEQWLSHQKSDWKVLHTA